MRFERAYHRHRELLYWIDDTNSLSLDEFIDNLFVSSEFLSEVHASKQEVKQQIENGNYPFAPKGRSCWRYTIVRKRLGYVEPVPRTMAGAEIKKIALWDRFPVDAVLSKTHFFLRKRNLCSKCFGEMCEECNYEGYIYSCIDCQDDEMYQVIYFDTGYFGSDHIMVTVTIENEK